MHLNTLRKIFGILMPLVNSGKEEKNCSVFSSAKIHKFKKKIHIYIKYKQKEKALVID